ncbi:hypothetical protein NGRA_0243 [Nosema granulosis]|uniref:Uncharacterized protein n=1 Tax=Nosema granulosis TaxID=83296 RepID=A0A9P6H0S1_9MICR|nr:hypothetical protein NGRA_0243 [Nosema granulosis]
MISDQLKKIKKEQKSILGRSNVDICFTGLYDVENETLLDLIPISTKYTSKQSLHFDRFRLSVEQEAKFNLKFSKFLTGLVVHTETPDIEYLYDFLIRKYHAHKFNAKELVFVILLQREYYSQLRKIDHHASLQWFDCQEEYSTHFIAELCIKDKGFFSLYVNYYEYYQKEHIQKFVNEITNLILQKIGTNVTRHISFFYEIISLLVGNQHREEAVKLYLKINPFIGENKAEFEDLVGEIGENEFVNIEKTSTPKIIENIETVELFKSTHSISEGRKYLKDIKYLKPYLLYLAENGYKDSSFNECEVDLIMNDNFSPKYPIETFKDLLEEIEDQKIVIENLVVYQKEDFKKILELIKHDHWEFVIKMHPFTYKNFINQAIYKEIEKILRKQTHQNVFNDFVKYCLAHHFLDLDFFDINFTYENALDCASAAIESNQINVLGSVLQICHKRKFKISKFLIEKEIYSEIVLDYIAKEVKRTFGDCEPHDIYLYNLSDIKYLDIVEKSIKTENNIPSVISVCNSKRIPLLSNTLVSHILNEGKYSDLFIDFIDKNLENITVENINRFLKSYGYREEIFSIIERIAVSKEKKIDVELISDIYKKGGYLILYKLCALYGFEAILKGLHEKNKRKFLIAIYKKNLIDVERTPGFLIYLSENLDIKDKEILQILINEYKNLILLKQSRNWDIIKLIIIEGLSQEYAQEMFEFLIRNLKDYEQDIDLIDKITSFSIDLDRQIVIKENRVPFVDLIFASLKSCLNIEIVEILINKLEYCDIRIIPFVAAKLIKNKKPSVRVFFKKYKNVMAPYVNQVIEEYPEIYESLYCVDGRILLSKIIEMCRRKNEVNDLSNSMIAHILKQEDVSPILYQSLATLYVDFLEQITPVCFINLLTKYKDEKFVCLLVKLFENRYDVFIDISPKTVKNMPLEYKTFIDSILEHNETSQKEYRFISEYLKYLPRDSNADNILGCFDRFLDSYLENEDKNLAKAISRSLNFTKDKNIFTKKILKHLKEPNTVAVLKLLQSIVRNTDDYKRQISLITPHLSLLVDSTKEEISSECHKFLEAVEKQYGFNPLVG